MTRERQWEWDKDPPDWTDAELAETLTERYKPTEVPPCHICGAPLSLQACGGGKPTAWACDGHDEVDGKLVYKPGRSFVDKHYSDSHWEDCRHGGDGAVMEALRRWKAHA